MSLFDKNLGIKFSEIVDINAEIYITCLYPECKKITSLREDIDYISNIITDSRTSFRGVEIHDSLAKLIDEEQFIPAIKQIVSDICYSADPKCIIQKESETEYLVLLAKPLKGFNCNQNDLITGMTIKFEPKHQTNNV